MKNTDSSPKRLRQIKVYIAAMFLFAGALVFFAPDAKAHAKLLFSKPADAEVLRERPAAIELTFSESVQTTSANVVVVTDARGERVDKNSAVVSEDGKKLLAALEDLPFGTDSVEWKTLFADNHPIKGKFTFTVAAVAAPVAPDSQSSGEANLERPAAPENQGESFQSLARWLMSLAAMMLFGGFAFLLFVLKPVFGRDIAGLDERERIFGFEQGKDRFVRLAWVSLSLLAASALVGLILQADAVTGGGNIRQLLAETSYGAFLLAKIALFLVMLALGGLNGYVVRSAAEKSFGETVSAGESSKNYTIFYRSLIFEAVLGIAVLLLAAVLAFLPPARSHETLHSDHKFFINQLLFNAALGRN